MIKSIKNIEIEFRAMFDEAKYNQLGELLKSAAQDLGEDDKNVYFFILSAKLLKVSNNISKQTAKITLKLEKIGKGNAFEELEIQISPDEVDRSVHLFKELGFDYVVESFQKRHNYLYEGVELALKYSKDWGYHLELEVVVDDESKKDEAIAMIKRVAEKLKVVLMTNEELLEFTQRFEKQHRV